MRRREGRPSKILNVVESLDPDTGVETEQPITKVILRFVSLGATQQTAAAAHGVTSTTLEYWKKRGAEVRKAQAEQHRTLTEEETAYAEFSEEIMRAEARGLMWHELNVRKAAASGKEQGGRLSLEFLARRQRAVYGRHDRVDHKAEVSVKHTTDFDAEVADLVAAMERSATDADDRTPAGSA